MGNQCAARPAPEQGESQLKAFRRLLHIANSKKCTNHQIITTLVEECKTLTDSNHFEFVYSRTVPAEHTEHSPPLSKYSGALVILIQGIRIGQLHFDEHKMTDSKRKSMDGLVMYAMQIMERNYLRLQASSVISVVGAQRMCKSIPAILAVISRFIEDSLHCEMVSLFRVDLSARKIIQLHPNHTTIPSFEDGILGHVVKTQEFIVFNDDGEQTASGVGPLRIETAGNGTGDRDVESLVCVPIMNNEAEEIDGLILALNKGDGAPFGHLEVDLLQILSVEIGEILENFATKINLTLDDAVADAHGSASSLLQYYRTLEADKDTSLFSADKPERVRVDSIIAAAKVVKKRRSVVDLFKMKMEELQVSNSGSATSDCHDVIEQKVVSDDLVLSSSAGKNSEDPMYGFLRKAMKPGSSKISPASSDSFSSNMAMATLLGQIQNISFDPFEHTPSELGEIAMCMFVDLKLINTLKVPPVPFSSFIKEIMGLYRNSNPYHNVYHGFSVLSFSYSFIKKTDLRSKFPALDLFALLISALCHDVDHPGNTNAFEIATDSELARKHNDQSVLENHHCNVAFTTMNKTECNFLADFSNADRKRLRKIVIQSILSTDMSHHFELCSTLDQIDKMQFQQNLGKKEKTDKFKQIICNVFVHTADLTAPVQPLVIALKWGKKVAQEFGDQVRKEKELGIESLAMMQGLDDQENFLKSQRGFYKFVLRPLFKSVARLWPDLNFLYLQLLNNEQYISEEADRLERKASEHSLPTFSRLQSFSSCPEGAKKHKRRKSVSSFNKLSRSETRILGKGDVAQIFERIDGIGSAKTDAS